MHTCIGQALAVVCRCFTQFPKSVVADGTQEEQLHFLQKNGCHTQFTRDLKGIEHRTEEGTEADPLAEK
jgi:hypothetical protein